MNPSVAVLRLADYGRMAIDVELRLARHSKRKNFPDTILLSFGYVMIKEKGAAKYEF